MGLGTASGAIAYQSMRTWRTDQGWLAVAGELAVMALLLAGGRWAIRQGNRHRARTLRPLAELPENEHIVLFLRSFADDAGLAQVQRGPARDGPWGASTDTEEQQLTKAVGPFGTMVALGRPRDRLPQTGAGRHYSSDEEWQAQVLAALDRAALVLLACGPGRNLRWEVEQVVARNRPERLVLVVVRDAAQYQSFRQAMQDVFPKGLPPSAGERRSWRESSDRLDGPDTYVRDAIWFDADWTPHLTPLGSYDPEVEVIWLIDRLAWVETAFPLAVRPVFRRAGLDLPGLPSGPVPRPWPVGIAVPLLALAWGGLVAVPQMGGTNGLSSMLVFVGLPIAGLLYRTWCGGQVAMGFVKIFSGIFALVLCLMPLVPGDPGRTALTPPSLPLGVAMLTGLLLLSRDDVRRWKASRAYRTRVTAE
jgi:hypothetical protein